MVRLKKSRITAIRTLMRFWIYLLLSLALPFGPALAACYTPVEAEAEQGIRIHSELMIIALTCQHRTPKGQENLYVQYRKFTAKHGPTLAAYERSLMNHFRANGVRDPEASINKLRTDFANKISNDAARMRPDKFCAAFLERVPRASKMTNTDLRRWASTPYAQQPVSKPMCAMARK